MARTPRTRAEKDAARERAWKVFATRFEHLPSWDDVWSIAYAATTARDRGGAYYTNLVYFMRYGSPPDGADAAQIAIYDALTARLGKVKPRGE